ncbi:MAG: prenyltransferase [Candidatus Hodarchaeales archaeon]
MTLSTLLRMVKLGRFHFLLGGFLLFTLGVLLALFSGAAFSLEPVLLGLIIVLLSQLSVSYGNDFFDLDVDRFNSPRLFSGGSGVLIENPELIPFAKWLAMILMGLAVLFAGVFVVLFSISWLFVGYVIVANFLGWCYSAPPLRLAYRGWGEITVALILGILTPGLGYLVLARKLDYYFLFFAVPLVLYVFAFIINVEIPDVKGDLRGDKKTLVVRKGQEFSLKLSVSAILLAIIYLAGSATLGIPLKGINAWTIGALSLIPLSVGVFSILKAPRHPELASGLAVANLLALISFLLLVDVYLALLLP